MVSHILQVSVQDAIGDYAKIGYMFQEDGSLQVIETLLVSKQKRILGQKQTNSKWLNTHNEKLYQLDMVEKSHKGEFPPSQKVTDEKKEELDPAIAGLDDEFERQVAELTDLQLSFLPWQ
jgi:hypothetical protein